MTHASPSLAVPAEGSATFLPATAVRFAKGYLSGKPPPVETFDGLFQVV